MKRKIDDVGENLDLHYENSLLMLETRTVTVVVNGEEYEVVIGNSDLSTT
ncbi:MAG: hypothetical protein FWF76_03140 [Oscillospiraceae bacterium]|nr:hypothetical protein [Oscillospiraceae bacterium]